ncbi:hypothetical protein, partial [Profundibacter sp.]
LHQSPLRIGDDKSIAQHTNLPFGRSESELNSNVNPESQQTLVSNRRVFHTADWGSWKQRTKIPQPQPSCAISARVFLDPRAGLV